MSNKGFSVLTVSFVAFLLLLKGCGNKVHKCFVLLQEQEGLDFQFLMKLVIVRN